MRNIEKQRDSLTGEKGCYYTLYYFSKPIADFGKACEVTTATFRKK